MRGPGQSASPAARRSACASVRQAALRFTWEPLHTLFNRTMDSWTVTSALLLAGVMSSAALSHFDTGKPKLFFPARLHFPGTSSPWLSASSSSSSEASPKWLFCARDKLLFSYHNTHRHTQHNTHRKVHWFKRYRVCFPILCRTLQSQLTSFIVHRLGPSPTTALFSSRELGCLQTALKQKRKCVWC